MDGNSLGILSRSAESAVQRALRQWRDLAIGGWLEADPPWFSLGEQLGARMAGLVGADSDEVVVTGTTTVNLHSLLATFYRPSGSRRRILADELNFPSDLYAMQSHLALRGMDPGRDLILAASRDGRTISEEDLIAAMDETVALVVLPSVLYRSGQLLDIARLTGAAHAQGIAIGFDLCHSAGVIPHQLSADDVDFAFWCTYKYLNSGPGGPAALYVNRRHHGAPVGMAGWWGYRKDEQFDMLTEWRPAGHAGGWQISTTPVLGTAALLGALEVTCAAGIETIRAKSLQLTSYLMYLIDEVLVPSGLGYGIGTPREPERRGGHVAVEHPEAVRVVKALRSRGVVPDFRPPDIIRLAPVPLYNTYAEVWQVVEHLRQIAAEREYERFPVGREVVS